MATTFENLTDANRKRQKPLRTTFGQTGTLTDPSTGLAGGAVAGAGQLQRGGGLPGTTLGLSQPVLGPAPQQPRAKSIGPELVQQQAGGQFGGGQQPGGGLVVPESTTDFGPDTFTPANNQQQPPVITELEAQFGAPVTTQFAPLEIPKGIAPTQPGQPSQQPIQQTGFPTTLQQPAPFGTEGDLIIPGKGLFEERVRNLGDTNLFGPPAIDPSQGIFDPKTAQQVLPAAPGIIPGQQPTPTPAPVTTQPVAAPSLDLDAQAGGDAGGATPGTQPGDTPPAAPAAPGGVTNDELIAAASESIFDQLTGKSIAADIALREGIDLTGRAAQTLGEARRSQIAASGLGGDGFEALLERKDAGTIMQGISDLNREVLKQRVADVQSGIVNANNLAATRSNLASAQISQVLNLLPFMTESNGEKAINDIAMSTLGIAGFDPNSVDPTTAQALSTFFQENLGMTPEEADNRAVGLIESEIALTERGTSLMLATLDTELGLATETAPEGDDGGTAAVIENILTNRSVTSFGGSEIDLQGLLDKVREVQDPNSINANNYSILDSNERAISVEQGFLSTWNPTTHLDSDGGNTWQFSNRPAEGSTVWFNGGVWDVGRRQIIDPADGDSFSAVTLRNVDQGNQFITLDPRPDGAQADSWEGTGKTSSWANNPLPTFEAGKQIKQDKVNEVTGSFDSNESDRILGMVGLKFI